MLQENSINFIVVEAQPLLRQSLTELITNQSFAGNIYSLRDYSEVHSITQTKSVHCILFDPMSDLSAASELMTFLSESRPHIYTIAYSMNTSMSYMRLFNTMGIMGVVSRLDSIETLEASLMAAANGYAFKKHQNYEQVNEVQLSERELTVLKLLTEGHRNKEVARRLNISDKTVSTYKKRVLEKFDVSNIMDLVPKVNACESFLTAR
ncbi:response regulator transcription factor [Vibrio barjaei]|jgi:DNA-binding NarL/FixJ family response regulator|uniref:Response regulator transcription factor n=1 Tax=Vibrio barjaei TaxID=1676683 RepID=A0ABW7IM05_9VIBR|nr:response regulator transcription factor [Vibrio barjaei]MCY9872653.1 response regulator transcription factor [Vibrio barjaei]